MASLTCHSVELEQREAWMISVSRELFAFIAPLSLFILSVVSCRHLSHRVMMCDETEFPKFSGD